MRFAGHTLQIRETRSERVEKTVISGLGKPTTTPSISDESGHLLAELSGSDSTEIIWLEDLPVAVKRAGAVHYTHADHLGTPRAVVTRGAGAKAIWQWDFLGTASGSNAFGDLEANADPDADGTHFIFDLRFPGQQKDQTGLNYNYFRDYEPATGRYVESDPIGLDGDISTYGYASNSPANFVDPEGLHAVVRFGWGIYRATDKINPYIQPYIAKAVDAVFEQSPDEVQKDIEHKAYKDICSRKPPDYLSPCELAKWKYRQQMYCQSKREDRWGHPQSYAPHQRALREVKRALRNAAEDIAKFCVCK